MRRDDFLASENWHGSYYELAMEFVPRTDDARLLAAIGALWSVPTLRGPWRAKEDFGNAPERPVTLQDDGLNSFYGTLCLADGTEIGCLSMTVREEDDSDWLDLSLPTGMLARGYSVRYPLTRRANRWLDAVDEQLVEIAERVYTVAPFALASIGEEVSGIVRAATLTTTKLTVGGVLLPHALHQQVTGGDRPIRRPNGLYWYPWRGDDFDHAWIPAVESC